MMESMKEPHAAKPISIPPDIAALCGGPDQADRVDRVFRAVVSVPHTAVTKDTKKRRRARARRQDNG